MAVSPYPIDPALTAISVVYKNPGYIADMVLPRIGVAKQEFRFVQFPTGAMFDVYDTAVGRRSRVNEVVLEGTETADFCVDQGLSAVVPEADMENADLRYNPRDTQTVQLTELIALGREQRVANLVFNTGSYGAGLTTTLSGTGQYSDYTNSDPVSGINGMLDLPLVRPNKLVFGQRSWTLVRSHPRIVQATKGTAQLGGIASRQQVAELFEVDEVLVGASRANNAKRGQTPSMARLWGNHIAGIYIPPVLTGQGEVAFGATFEWMTRTVREGFNPKIGLRGATEIVVGESVKERIIANQAGFYIQNAVA
jgi:hypothetical protein